MTNDTPDDTTDFNENPTIKTLKNQAIIDITKTDLSNINNERNILYKLLSDVLISRSFKLLMNSMLRLIIYTVL